MILPLRSLHHDCAVPCGALVLPNIHRRALNPDVPVASACVKMKPRLCDMKLGTSGTNGPDEKPDMQANTWATPWMTI